MFHLATKYLRFTPYPTDTSEGRASERYRLAALSALSSVTSRVATALLMVLSVGATVSYLGAERFGLWMTIASCVAFLAFMDFGVGNALTNYVAHQATSSTRDEFRGVISGCVGLMLLIALLAGLLLYLVVWQVPVEKLFNAPTPGLIKETSQTLLIFPLIFSASTFSTGVQKLVNGLQLGYKVNLINTACTLATIPALMYAAKSQVGIATLFSVTLSGQIVSGLLLVIVLGIGNYLSLHKIGLNVTESAKSLLKTSTMFFALQVAAIVGWGSDSLIIASTLGVAQVAIFAVVQRLFILCSAPMHILNSPLWSAYADAQARGDSAFISTTLIRSVRMTLIGSTILVVILIVFGQQIISKWTDGKVQASEALILSYAIWAVIEALHNSVSYYLNGCSIVRPQVVTALLFCLLCIPLKFLALNYFGIVGAPISTIFAYLITTPFVYYIFFRSSFTKPMHESARTVAN